MNKLGYDVLVSDIREDYVNDLNQKKITTNEPEVEDLLRVSKNFRPLQITKKSLMSVISSTPLSRHHQMMMDHMMCHAVWNVVEDFKDVTKKKYFVVGCTTNPGDCDLFQKQVPTNVKVLYNPEFIAQGSIVSDLKKADMVLLGVDQDFENDSTVNDIRELYRRIQTTRAIVCTMSTKSAEITKIMSTAFLTTKISYANMLGDVLTINGMW